jgi:hypothetical protein
MYQHAEKSTNIPFALLQFGKSCVQHVEKEKYSLRITSILQKQCASMQKKNY